MVALAATTPIRRLLRIACRTVYACVLAGLPASAAAQSVDDGFNPGANQPAEAAVVQPDGSILLGGQFTTIGGVSRVRLARLRPDGRLDGSFMASANGAVYALHLQPDGRILVGGSFTQINGQPRPGIARLQPDGQLDPTFDARGGGAAVLTIALEGDGRILLGGTFTTMAGQVRRYVARLHVDGSLDQTFAPLVNELVYDIAVQRDGRILLAGGYTLVNGQPRARLARLFADGSLDPSFRADASGAVLALALQDDGRLVVGGQFQTVAGAARPNLARLEPNGALDVGFTSTADASVQAIAVQPDGRIVVGGAFLRLGGFDRARMGRLHPDGSVDATFVVGANNIVTMLVGQPDGGVIAGGVFTTVQGLNRQRIARVTEAARVDYTLSALISDEVLATATQPDGGLLVGGWFSAVAATQSAGPRSRLARLLPDGRLDPGFAPAVNGTVYAIAVQYDGRILIGGTFTEVNGVPRARIARLHPNGVLDASFVDALANGPIYALALQADGRIVAGGGFDAVGGLPRGHVARLHADGTVDASFTGGVDDGLVFTLAIDPDDKVLVGGSFEFAQRQPRPGLVRLHTDGRLDPTFAPGAGGSIRTVVVLPDRRLLVGGALTLSDSSPASIARLRSDGRYDRTFRPSSGVVHSLALHHGGEVTVGGSFSRFGDLPRSGLARVDADGQADFSFNPGVDGNGVVFGLAFDPSGKLAVGGLFSSIDGEFRGNLGRLGSGLSQADRLRVRADGSGVDWIRMARAPELLHVTFDISTDRMTWTPLGTPVRTREGWTLSGVSIPFDVRVFVRARGRHSGGYGNASVSVVERVATAYLEADPDEDGLPTAWELFFGTDAEGYDRDADPDGDGLTNAQELQQGTHPRGTFVRYLAEGATSAFFRTRLAMLNPRDATASIVLRFLRADGTTARHEQAIGGHVRATVDVGTLPDMADAPAFATVLESDREVVLDRTMQWDASGYGSHAETSLESPRTRWYLAEGATHSGFALFYLLQNPNPVPADVRVTYLLPSGPPLVRSYVVDPTSRLNIWVNQIPELAATDVSAVIEVTNGRPIVVERAMYLSRGGQLFGAGHASAGVAEPGTVWFLAEGATGAYFDLFLLLANPDATRDAQVDVTYLLPDGSTRAKRYVVAPQSRFTIWVDEEVFPGQGKALADTAVSAAVTSINSVPIVVERAMWWPGPASTWLEAHNSAGARRSGTRWALADGEDGGSSNTETYILIANVSTQPGVVRVTVVFEDGTTDAATMAVAATSRLNVSVRDEFASARGRRFGALVESLDGTPLVVERAMYSDSAGQRWAAGTNALATRLQ